MAEKGNRKFSAQKHSQLIVLCGFAMVVYSHAVSKTPVTADLFMWFIAGAVGNVAAFMIGNSQEHKYNSAPTTPPAAPTP